MVRVNLHLVTELGDPGWEVEQPHPTAILFYGGPAKPTKRQKEEMSALQLTEPSLLPAGARKGAQFESSGPNHRDIPASKHRYLLGLVFKEQLAAPDMGFELVE